MANVIKEAVGKNKWSQGYNPEGKITSWSYHTPTGIRGFSLPSLAKDYKHYTRIGDKRFLEELPAALHYACIVSYYNELTPEQTLLDDGLIHEMIHLLHLREWYENAGELDNQVKIVRKMFKELVKVS